MSGPVWGLWAVFEALGQIVGLGDGVDAMRVVFVSAGWERWLRGSSTASQKPHLARHCNLNLNPTVKPYKP